MLTPLASQPHARAKVGGGREGIFFVFFLPSPAHRPLSHAHAHTRKITIITPGAGEFFFSATLPHAVLALSAAEPRGGWNRSRERSRAQI